MSFQVPPEITPDYEVERMKAVRRYDVLDTPPDGAFDRVTAIAARIFHVPIAIISIVDHDRIWFKSHHGLPVSRSTGRRGFARQRSSSETHIFLKMPPKTFAL
jgi:hypothetical protein